MQSYKECFKLNAVELVLKWPSWCWNMQSSPQYRAFTSQVAFLKTGSISWEVKRLLKHLSLDKAKDVHLSLSERWKDSVQVKFEWWPSLKRMKNGMTNKIHEKKRWHWASRSQSETPDNPKGHKPRMLEEHVFDLLSCRQVQNF